MTHPPHTPPYRIPQDVQKQINQGVFAADDRFPANRFLEFKALRPSMRAHSIKYKLISDPEHRTDLTGAITVVGTCMDMCPEYERHEREFQKDVDDWEKIPGTNPKRIDHAKAVKKYRRSAAGNDEPLESDLRPPGVLKMTLDYLFYDLLDKHGLDATYAFIRDRTRAIRTDFTIQHEKGAIAIECFERIARFHILALHRFCERDDIRGFDYWQEVEQMMKTLQSLMQFYDDNEGKLHSPNEAEFRAYYILAHIRDTNSIRRLQALAPNIFLDPVLQTAIEFRSYAQRNTHMDRRTSHRTAKLKFRNSEACQNAFTRLFKRVQDEGTSYLMACLLEYHFGGIRKGAIHSLWRAYTARHRPLPTSNLMVFLGLDDEEKTLEVARRFGMASVDESGETSGTAAVQLNKASKFEYANQMSQRHSINLVETKRDGMSDVQIVDGGFKKAVVTWRSVRFDPSVDVPSEPQLVDISNQVARESTLAKPIAPQNVLFGFTPTTFTPDYNPSLSTATFNPPSFTPAFNWTPTAPASNPTSSAPTLNPASFAPKAPTTFTPSHYTPTHLVPSPLTSTAISPDPFSSTPFVQPSSKIIPSIKEDIQQNVPILRTDLKDESTPQVVSPSKKIGISPTIPQENAGISRPITEAATNEALFVQTPSSITTTRPNITPSRTSKHAWILARAKADNHFKFKVLFLVFTIWKGKAVNRGVQRWLREDQEAQFRRSIRDMGLSTTSPIRPTKGKKKPSKRADDAVTLATIREVKITRTKLWERGSFVSTVVQRLQNQLFKPPRKLPSDWEVWLSSPSANASTAEWLKVKFGADQSINSSEMPGLYRISLPNAGDIPVGHIQPAGLIVFDLHTSASASTIRADIRRLLDMMSLLPSNPRYAPAVIILCWSESSDSLKRLASLLDDLEQDKVIYSWRCLSFSSDNGHFDDQFRACMTELPLDSGRTASNPDTTLLGVEPEIDSGAEREGLPTPCRPDSCVPSQPAVCLNQKNTSSSFASFTENTPQRCTLSSPSQKRAASEIDGLHQSPDVPEMKRHKPVSAYRDVSGEPSQSQSGILDNHPPKPDSLSRLKTAVAKARQSIEDMRHRRNVDSPRPMTREPDPPLASILSPVRMRGAASLTPRTKLQGVDGSKRAWEVSMET